MIETFENYDDPKKARFIWEDYFPEIGRYLLDQAIHIVKTCDSYRSLDVRLSKLILDQEEPISRTTGGARLLVDPDSNGCWANNIKILEDNQH